jgi:hypothetical protein
MGGAFKRGGFVTPVLSLLLLFQAGNVFGAPCRGHLVNTGEGMAEVVDQCGEATMKERRLVTVEVIDEQGTTKTATAIDEWTYDLGPEEPAQTYRFENGILAEIRSNGYGRSRDLRIDPCRNGEVLAVGDTTADAYLKCGDPLARERLKDKLVETEEGGKKYRTFLPVMEWTYRFGPDAPGYTVTFENGASVKIRPREFGK